MIYPNAFGVKISNHDSITFVWVGCTGIGMLKTSPPLYWACVFGLREIGYCINLVSLSSTPKWIVFLWRFCLWEWTAKLQGEDGKQNRLSTFALIRANKGIILTKTALSYLCRHVLGWLLSVWLLQFHPVAAALLLGDANKEENTYTADGFSDHTRSCVMERLMKVMLIMHWRRHTNKDWANLRPLSRTKTNQNHLL